MKEKLITFNNKVKSFWQNRSKGQRGIFIGSLAVLILLIATIILFVSNPKFTPLYNDLSVQEVSQIKDELDARNIPYEIKNSGTTIEVPEGQESGLVVDLAGQGIPQSGNIDYSFFSENTSWGVTDNEFDIMKLDAMQTELANLIQNIKGINHADVMINIPDDPLFVSESMEEASASVVIHTEPGYEFRGNQIDSLYHLVSKAVPNLPEDNIVIMNQYFEYYDQSSLAGGYDGGDTYAFQQEVKQDTERDIQRRLQQMLGTMVGRDQVIVSVTADIDFTQENRTEELVDPVDVENIEGLPVSIEKIRETYSGNPPVGGDIGTGEEDVPGYQGNDEGDNGEYELDKETINNEFNRIQKEIVESPYKIRDLGIQVAVDNVKERDGNDITYLSTPDQEAVESGVSSILDSIISSSIDKEFGEINPEEKTSIVFQEFSEQAKTPQTSLPTIPLWMYITGGILFVIIIVLVVLLIRSKKSDFIFEETVTNEQPEEEVPSFTEDEDSDEVKRRKQLEKMAQDKPEDFAKLLRSWISEE